VTKSETTTPVAGVPTSTTTPVVSTTPPPEETFHIVQKGDTLSRISRKYKVSIDEICDLNFIKKSSILRVGFQLRVK